MESGNKYEGECVIEGEMEVGREGVRKVGKERGRASE